MAELNNKLRAEVYQELAESDEFPLTPEAFKWLTDKVNKLDPPAPCTIDKVDGWEVVWCSHGAIALEPLARTALAQWKKPVGVQANGTLHPWPERPEPLLPEGWTLILNHDLKEGKHEILNPGRGSWTDTALKYHGDTSFRCLIAARELETK